MQNSSENKGSNMDNAPGTSKLISLHLLEEITNGFSKDRKLGGGEYGDVYLGEHDGEKIAVKVLKGLDVDDELFEKEYHNLASLHHQNVVQLVGYCHETKKECVEYNGRMVFAEHTKRVLCFKYMHNGGLDNFIYDESNSHNWRTRYAIIKGICDGLQYLHEKKKMYHLDLKPSNVLLDENMFPKIADFGLSRLLKEDKTKKTKSAIGTFGYVPPEYIDEHLISPKYDIYSLGVMIIKIMAGRDGYSKSAEMSSQQFVDHVHADWMNRLQATSVHAYSIQIRRCIKIALSCVEDDRHKRPSIGVIVNNLSEMESTKEILDALRNGSGSPIYQVCPCIISNETEMLDIVKNKFISYPLSVTDNRGKVHEARITTFNDLVGDTSTSELVRPKIKVIDCTDSLDGVTMIDPHSTEPWILAGHFGGNVSIWNHQNLTRVMAFHIMGEQGQDDVGIGAAKFVEPGQCFVVGDSKGNINVYSYVTTEKLQKFGAHTDCVTSLAVHPSEPLLLSAAHDNLIKLWNWETGWQCIRTFNAHIDSVYHVKFNPQTAGKTFASSSRDSTLKIWNIHSPTPVATLDCDSHYKACLDYFIPTGDRQYLAAGSRDGNAGIWDLQANTSTKRIDGLQEEGCNIAVVESLSGCQILLTVSRDHTVAFCDSTTHRYENRVNFNLGMVYDFAYINGIKSLAIGCEKGIAIMEIN